MANSTSPNTPLAGIRVADFGHHRAGPHCAFILARLGAEVIKIEPLGGEQLRSHGPHWAIENNTKKSITVDLRRPEGKQIALDLIGRSDIVVQNFRPGVMDRLGLGNDALLAHNPRIIIANVSAFGAASKQRLKPGFDGIMQALTGLMMLNGASDDPPIKTHPPIVDRIAGLHAAVGCLAAIVERERSGRGQALDVALLGSAYTIPDADLAWTLTHHASPPRTGNRAGGPPVNNAFQVKDGWIYIATGGREVMWQGMCRLIGRAHWIEDAELSTKQGRMRRSAEIDVAVQEFFIAKTQAQALALLAESGIPVAPVRTPLEAVEDTYPFDHRYLVYAEGLEQPTPVTGDVWHFSRSEVNIGRLPGPGEHTEEVLAGLLGYASQQVASLRGQGVIG